MPERPGWSVPVTLSLTGSRCHADGSGAPVASPRGGVLSTLSRASPTSAEAMPAPEMARALIVVTPSGICSSEYAPSRVSIVPSGSDPSVVTE